MYWTTSPLERAAVPRPKARWHLAPTNSFTDNFRTTPDCISYNCSFHLRYIELYWQVKIPWADATTKCSIWYFKNTGTLPLNQSIQHCGSTWNALEKKQNKTHVTINISIWHSGNHSSILILPIPLHLTFQQL